ncbi:hypothetical protein ACHAW6_009887, partial [Cyclotella cf. meneghiniana]
VSSDVRQISVEIPHPIIFLIPADLRASSRRSRSKIFSVSLQTSQHNKQRAIVRSSSHEKMNRCLPHRDDDDYDDDDTLCTEERSAFLSIIQTLPSSDYPSVDDDSHGGGENNRRRPVGDSSGRWTPSSSWHEDATVVPFSACGVTPVCEARPQFGREGCVFDSGGCLSEEEGDDDDEEEKTSAKEADDEETTVPTNDEGVSLCSVTTERPDCFELGRDVGSPSRHATLYNAVRFHQGGEPDGIEDGDNVTVSKDSVPLLCDAPKKKGGAVTRVLSKLKGGPKLVTKAVENHDAGLASETRCAEESVGVVMQGQVPRNRSLHQVSNNDKGSPADITKSHSKVVSECLTDPPPKSTSDAVNHRTESQDAIPSVCDNESTAATHSRTATEKTKSTDETQITNTSSLEIAPTSSFGTDNETESSSNSSAAHIPKKTRGSLKTRVASTFLKKWKSKRSPRIVVTDVENADSRSENDNDDPHEGRLSDRCTILVNTYYEPSEERGISQESTADNKVSCVPSPTPGTTAMEPAVPNDSIELDAAGSIALTPSKEKNTLRESIVEKVMPCNLSPVPKNTSVEPAATNDPTPSIEREIPQESNMEKAIPCDLSPIQMKPSIRSFAINDSIELDVTGSLTLTATPPDESDNPSASRDADERCCSFLTDVSRTLFPEEPEGHHRAVSKERIGPCDFPSVGSHDENYAEATTIECTLRNNDFSLLDVTIGEVEANGTSASQEEAMNPCEHDTHVSNEGGTTGNGGVVECSSPSTVASEDREKIKESNFNDLFQMGTSSLAALFRRSGPSSDRNRHIEAEKPGIAEDVRPSSEDFATQSQTLSEKPSFSEDGISTTDNLVFDFQEKAVEPECDLSCHHHEPSHNINDTIRNPRRLDKKNRVIHPHSKIEWARSLRNRSQSMRMRSFRYCGNIESKRPLTQKDGTFCQNKPFGQDIFLQVLGENVEATLPV